MKKFAKGLVLALAAAMLMAFSGCSGTQHEVGFQLEAPQSGDTIAVMDTSMGTIKMRLFPDEAPKTVENFIGLANKGYFNGLTFHRVINNFMIQSGDPTATGTGGESYFGGDFEDEFSTSLLNLRGAVAMANKGPNTNSSQFFINQSPASSFAGWDYYEQGYQAYKTSPDAFTAQYGNWVDMDKVSAEVKALYEENGGNPTLDGAYTTTGKGHTVFAQVYEGMDVVDRIAAVDVESDKPVSDVVIHSVTITEFE